MTFTWVNIAVSTFTLVQFMGTLSTSDVYIYMKSSFPKRYKSILIVFMKITFFYLDPYILLIFNLSC